MREIGGGKLRIEMARGRPTHGTGLGADITPVRPTPRRPWWWVPWALVQFGNWPIHGVPTGEQLRDLGDAVVSDTAVFAVLTVAAWAVWSVFLASLLV